MKIRTRLVLWHYFTSLILLLVFSIATYIGMRHLLIVTLDKELSEKKDDIISSYNPKTKTFEALNHPYFVETELSNFYLIILDENNKEIFETKMVNAANMSLKAITGIENDTSFTKEMEFQPRFYLPNRITSRAVFRFMGERIILKGEKIGYIVIGYSFEKLNESMDKLLFVLLIGIALISVLIFFISYFLTERSLKPIDKLIDQAQQISHQNLSERLKVDNPDDEIGRLTNVLNDLLKRLQDAFDKEQEFMSDAAHELKTPLTVLRTHWEDELSSKKLPVEFKEKLVKDIETITRLSKLINNLLLLSSTEYFQIRADFEKVNLDELIKEVVSNTNVLAEIKNQTINTIEIDHVNIDGDKTKLYQLLFNIVDNAIKYTPENGSIIISLKRDQSNAIIEIKDNGIGIPEEDLQYIFRRFYRVHKDRSKKSGGNGLGLSIAKLITDIHKGQILVESKPDKGTTFIIKIPFVT